jgi:hypothetical protein
MNVNLADLEERNNSYKSTLTGLKTTVRIEILNKTNTI